MVGISFHVGSGCADSPIYSKAILAAKKLFDFGETVGYNFNLLDIGGGFPGDTNTDIHEVSNFENICRKMNIKKMIHFFSVSIDCYYCERCIGSILSSVA